MNCTNGLITALTRPKITPTTKMTPTCCGVESNPSNRMPGTINVTTHNAKPVNAARSRKAPMRSVCRTQQVGVHDPAVSGAGVGARRDDSFADVTDRAGEQQLVGCAEIGAPPDAGAGRAILERTVGVEHHDRAARQPAL